MKKDKKMIDTDLIYGSNLEYYRGLINGYSKEQLASIIISLEEEIGDIKKESEE